MINRITIENFKGIGSKVEIDLRPVTLLFGANSSGKSTILHALHYLHSILETGDGDVRRTQLGGALDLGGFPKLVHNHDLDNVIRFSISFDSDSDFDGSYQFEVDIEVRWSRILERAVVTKFALYFGELHFVEIECSLDGHTNINRLFERHSVFFDEENYSCENCLEDEYCEEHEELYTRHFALAVLAFEDRSNFVNNLHCLSGRRSAIPWWERKLGIDEDSIHLLNLGEDSTMLSVTEKMIIRSGKSLLSQLESVLYLGPYRSLPQKFPGAR